MKQLEETKSSGLALIPFLLFIVIYMGAGIILQMRGVEMAFYQFPSVVAMSIAVIAAFVMFHKAGINENFATFAKGAASEDVVTMLMIYLLAGGFSAVAGAMGGIESTVNLGVSIIPAHLLTAGIFVISAFMATATGTSMGTVGAIVPIAVGVVDKAGLSMPLVMAACMSGAMFGDNLSMISDTTIAATRTQGVELKDKFRTNFWCALPAAIIALVLLVAFGRPEHAVVIPAGNYELIKVVPYMLVLVLALMGINVFLVLLFGIVSAGIIGIACGDLTVITFATNVWEGYKSMIEVFLLSMFGGGAVRAGGSDGYGDGQQHRGHHRGRKYGQIHQREVQDRSEKNRVHPGCVHLHLSGHDSVRCPVPAGGIPDQGTSEPAGHHSAAVVPVPAGTFHRAVLPDSKLREIDPLRRMGLGEPHRHPIVVEGDEFEWKKIEIRSSCGPAWWASSPTFCWRALRLLWG